MIGNAVRPAGERPCDKTSEQATEPQNLVIGAADREPASKKSLTDEFEDKTKGLFGK